MTMYREILLSSAASMALHILADQSVAKTEEARREFGNQAYNLLDYALVPDSVRGELPVTPEIEILLKEVASLAEFQSRNEATVAPDNEIPIERIDFSKQLHTKVDVLDYDVDAITVDLDKDLTTIPVDAETEARIDRALGRPAREETENEAPIGYVSERAVASLSNPFNSNAQFQVTLTRNANGRNSVALYTRAISSVAERQASTEREAKVLEAAARHLWAHSFHGNGAIVALRSLAAARRSDTWKPNI